MSKRLTLPELCFTWFGLFIMADAVISLIVQGENADVTGSYEGVPLLTAASAAVFLGAGLLLIKRPRRVLELIDEHRWLVLLVVVVLVSTVWSGAVTLTLRRAVALAGTTLFGVYLAERFGPVALLRVLGWTYAVLLAISLLFVLLMPEYGLHEKYDFAWRGVFTHKNGLGHICAQAAILFGAFALGQPKQRSRFMLLALGALFMLVMSDSKTALIGFMAAGMILMIRSLVRIRSPLLVLGVFATLWLIGVGGYLMWVYWIDLLNLLGKDATLTGRTLAWGMAIQGGLERPFIGYGYRAFWLPWSNQSPVLQYLAWDLGNGHNSYLDIWLELGLLGFGLFVIYLVVVWQRMLRVMMYPTTAATLFWPMMLGYLCVAGLGRTMLLQRNEIAWVLFVIVAVQSKNMLQAHRSRIADDAARPDTQTGPVTPALAHSNAYPQPQA